MVGQNLPLHAMSIEKSQQQVTHTCTPLSILGTALPVSNGRQGAPNMKIEFYRYFDFCVSLKITFNNGKTVGCNNLDMMKDKKIQLFSFPNNNDKHLETSISAVPLRESTSTKCQHLSNKTTIMQRK